MRRSLLFTSILLGLVGWGIAEVANDEMEETIMLRNHALPGVDYERDPAPAPHLVLVTNSGNGRPPVFQLDTVHMNMEEQFGVLGVTPAGRGQDDRRNPEGQRNPAGQRNPEGQRNPGNRRNPNRRNSEDRRSTNEQNRYRSEPTEDLHRFNWWRQQ